MLRAGSGAAELLAMLKMCPVCHRIHDVTIKCKRDQPPRASRADRFRNTKQWQNARNEARERDLNLCVVCRAAGEVVTDDLSVHHIVPLEENFDMRDDLSNLITLCSYHHELAERGAISRSELRKLVCRFAGQPEVSPPV